jgi:uncharacterized membrane protein YkoI
MSGGRSDHRCQKIVRQIPPRLQSAVRRKLRPYCPLLKPNAHFMNLASCPIGAMQRKQTFIGIVLLSLALVPCAAMAELNDGSLSSTRESAPVHRETNMESDQRFFAAFRAAPLSLMHAIAIAERLHTGSRTAAISFDTSDNPFYRVRTVKDKEIWENVVDVHTGRTAGPETLWSLNDLEIEERDNINALRSVKQELSDAVAIAEKAAAGKAISGGLVKEGDQLNFVVVVLSDDRLKEVFLEPPRAASKGRPVTSRRN